MIVAALNLPQRINQTISRRTSAASLSGRRSMRSSRSGKLILDSRLPDGSRLAAVFPPCSVGGTTLTIHKFQTRFFTADELVRIVTMTPEVLGAVRSAIEKNESILISGRDHYRQDDGAERARGVPAAD